MLYDSIISEAGHGVNRDAAPLMERVDGVVVAADALGHTFGVRVQWTRLRREGSEGSKGSKGSEGGGGSSAAIFKVSVTGLAVCVICDTISSATYFLVSP